MRLTTFLEIPDDSTAYAERDWDGARGWIWRYEIGNRPGDIGLTFAFEKVHREDGTTLFLATFHDYADKLADRIFMGSQDDEPEQLADEIVGRFLAMAGSVRPPAYVGEEMRAHLSAWISEQRGRSAEHSTPAPWR